MYTLETSVTQDRNNRFSAVGCQTDGARVRLLNTAITHQMAGNGLLCWYSFIYPERMKG